MSNDKDKDKKDKVDDEQPDVQPLEGEEPPPPPPPGGGQTGGGPEDDDGGN